MYIVLCRRRQEDSISLYNHDEMKNRFIRMKKKEKKKYIRDIYNLARKEWKTERKQKEFEFYLIEEIRRELQEDPERLLELKASCYSFSDCTDIEILISLLSIFIGKMTGKEEVLLLISVLLLSIVAIFFTYPHKQCKFAFDNIELCEFEKVVVKEDHLCDKVTINNMIRRIEDLKYHWLQRKISLVELGEDVERLIDDLKKEADYDKMRKYIENKLILEENLEKSRPLIRKCLEKYAREKSFYEIISNSMESNE